MHRIREKKKLANAKKSIKNCWKYDLLQHSCILSYLSYCSELEVCWHGEALNLERLSPKAILIPADIEIMDGPVVQLPTPVESQAGSDSTITLNLPLAPATAVLLQAARTLWQWTKPTLPNFFCVPRQDLQLLFYSFASISLRQLSLLTWNIYELKSFQQLSFWPGKKNLTKPPWLLVVTLSVLSA